MADLKPEQSEAIAQLLASGQKVQAVQQYRLFTGVDLRSAIDAVSAMPGGRDPAPKKSPWAWLVFALVLLAMLALPGYMVYDAFFKNVQPEADKNAAVGPARTPPAVAVDTDTPPPERRPRRNPNVIRPQPVAPASPASPLFVAIRGSKFDEAIKLIDAGADVNAPATDGPRFTPLMEAVGFSADSALPLVQKLVEKGADVNAKAPTGGYSPMMRAVRFRSPKTVAYLLSKGADVKVTTRRGESAMDWAKQVNNPEIIALLEKAGAAPTTEPAK